MLFVELALIRWSASNVVYLAYFTNFVLLASFLGIGVGFLRARRPADRSNLAPVALFAFVAFVLAFPVTVSGFGTRRTLVMWFDLPALPIGVELPLIFVGAAAVMALIAEAVARTFVTFEPLEAYRLDIAGSILGIAAFSLLSFLGAPPFAWGLVAATAMVALVGWPPGRWQAAATMGLVALLVAESFSPGTAWSPYYEVRAHALGGGVIGIRVNGLPHQSIVPLARLPDAAIYRQIGRAHV